MSATATGIVAFGTKIKVGDGQSPQNFYIISGVGDISLSESMDKAEKTSHSSTQRRRQFLPTLRNGTLSFPCNFDPADDTHSISSTFGIEYLYRNGLTRAFQVLSLKADGTTLTRQFDGFVANMSESYAVDGIQTRDVEIQINTDPSSV